MPNDSTRIRALALLAVVLATIALDQLSKWAVLSVLGMATRPPIDVTGFFQLVLVWNHGVSFGMLQHEAEYMPWFLMLVAIVISLVLVRLGMQSRWWLERLGYGLVIGGALGNVIDRARYRAVVDFLHLHAGGYSWPAFNIADAAICVGVALLLWAMRRHPATP